MNRRNFVKKAGIIGTVAFAPISCSSMVNHSKYKLGYQLFSIRDQMAIKPIETLKALKKMGYQDFEIYGYDDKQNSIYGFTPKELKKVLDDLDLTVTSGHYGFSSYLDKDQNSLSQFVDNCISCAKSLKSNYITWPWIAPEQRNIETFKLMSQKLNVIGEQVTKAGLGFAYHNHGFEFDDHNGENGFDIIIKETDASLVKLEMDMYWVMHSSKYTPQELIDKQPGRYALWHIKDMDKVTRDYTELGNGSIDYTKLLPSPIDSGLEHYYIEQGGNFAVDSLVSAASSAKYFQKNLKQLL